MRKKAIAFTSTIFVIAIVILGSKVNNNSDLLNKPLTNDYFNYIAINQILMYCANNGDGSHDPGTDAAGFYWPGGINAVKTAIFEDGLIWGCKIGREIRVNGNTHRQGLEAGKILPNGQPDNPGDPRYRVYKIRKGWDSLPPGSERDEYEKDFNEWPVEDGAPWVDVDKDGVFTPGVDSPEFVGDEVLWYVANDMDEGRATFTYGTSSIGLEFQTTIFGFNRTGDLGDIVFKKYLIINKGSNTCNDMVFGYWSDTDLGDAEDDYTGCDIDLSLGYTYNADNKDGTGTGVTYGDNPPAVGYDFFQGPIVPASATDSAKFLGKWRHGYRNLGLTAFTLYINPDSKYKDPDQGVAAGSQQFYNYLTGYIWNGNPFINPYTGEEVKFCVPGDPVAGTGWYEGDGWPGGPPPGDRRHLMASGPITLAPGDSQEVVVGIVIARGTSNLNSVTVLKEKDALAQIAYDLDFNLTPSPPSPKRSEVEKDRTITLYWEKNAESYNELDPLIEGKDNPETGLPYDNVTYTFEGYRVLQFRDLAGTDPRLIGIYDIENGIGKDTPIYGNVTINGELVSVPVIKSPDEGLRYFQTIKNDAYSNERLRNGNPYYFAVTAYAYSPYSTPQHLESPPQIVEVFPGTRKIDESFPYDSQDNITAEHIDGPGDGYIHLKVVDPNVLTGDEYRVSFGGDETHLSYTFVNYTTNDTIIADCTNLAIDTVQADIIDGFLLNIFNTGLDEIRPSRTYSVKEVVELKGPGGVALDKPRDVFQHENSTGDWEITSYGIEAEPLQNINIDDKYALGYSDYEIRFTSTGSQYYTTGSQFSFFPWAKDDSLAPDRVPFEIWDMGRPGTDADDRRLVIKTLDSYASNQVDSVRVDRNGKWSQLADGDWEPIFAYVPTTPYQEPLPETSGSLRDHTVFKFGKVIIRGNLPAEGTVIGINAWLPLSPEDVFSVVTVQPNMRDFTVAKQSTDEISVFPNPYFGANPIERDKYQRFVRFTNLPTRATVRIFSLAGVYIQRIDKNDQNQWLDWDLRNKDGLPVGSGVYIAYIEMPNIGEKILKLAVIMETQYIDRL